MTLRFEISQSIGHDDLGALWRDLETRSDRPFFLSWDWIGCWIEETGIDPFVLIGRARGRVVVLGILVPARRRIVGPVSVTGARLHTTGEHGQDVITVEYNGFLVDREHGDAAQDEAIAYVLRGQRLGPFDCNELHIYNVTRTHQAMAGAGGLMHAVVWAKPSYRINLGALRRAGRGYLDSLSGNTRQQIRRSMRLYERRGPLTARRASGAAEALEFLDRLKVLHQQYWVGRGHPGGFSYPFFERFQHRLIAARAPSGTAELVEVSCGEQAIGYLYNFVDRGHVYAYQSGFLFEADPKLKPGLVSHTLCAEMHYRDGTDIYDFMAGAARYKANLGEPGPDMHYVLLQRPTFAARLESALHTAKGYLVAWLRRARGGPHAADP